MKRQVNNLNYSLCHVYQCITRCNAVCDLFIMLWLVFVPSLLHLFNIYVEWFWLQKFQRENINFTSLSEPVSLCKLSIDMTRPT